MQILMVFISFLAIASLFGCRSISIQDLNSNSVETQIKKAPTISSKSQLDSLFKNTENRESVEVRVMGIYRKVYFPGNSTYRYRGNVAVVLPNTKILLYPIESPNAIRSLEEIERYQGWSVAVTGRVVPECFYEFNNKKTRATPCFVSVENIEIIPLAEMLQLNRTSSISRHRKKNAIFPLIRRPENLPIISSWEEFQELFHSRDRHGLEVRVVGIYEQNDVRKRQTPPPVYHGHVAISFNSGGGILLYPAWHSISIRSREEIERYEGRSVMVTGRVVPQAPPPPSGVPGGVLAAIVSPSFVAVDKIELAPLEESSPSATPERQQSDREENKTIDLPTKIPRH
ncbi:hypothetical protein POG22_12310 [Geitlerinema sp. CS-897]|nr:hypothetical protein [Geitlerinema sp. CS-897]